MPHRWGIRVRLAALFAAALILMGGAVLGATYGLLSGVLSSQAIDVGSISPNDGSATTSADAKRQLAEGTSKVRDQLRSDTLHILGRRLIPVAAGMAVLALWGGWLLAGHALRPIEGITRQARRAVGTGSHQPIAVPGPRDELHDLADTIDDLLARLEAATDGQWRFVANASHELKTPLAINRTLLEVAMRRPDAPVALVQLGETLLEVNARHERLIEGLLTMARSEHAGAAHVPVDLAALLARAAQGLGTEARRVGVRLDLDAVPAPVSGDPALLERLATNLLQNAVRYNVESGWVRARTGLEGASAHLVVENSGPQILPVEVNDLFEPFKRLRDRVGAADGSGLGLSIVRSIVRAHGGEVSASPRPDGGLVVEVRLPASA